MTETAAERYERVKRQGRGIAALFRSGPHEPIVTREQVLETSCAHCGAQPGQECKRTPMMMAGMALRGMSGVHMRRYQDLAHDPR